jgi:uncharacterized protein
MFVMHFDILSIIFLTSIIQSIFGTGVLLFGTPLMLILGYDFQYSLSILLPTSVLINFLQLKNKYLDINLKFYKKLVLYSIPIIVICLYMVSLKIININFLIGGFLVLLSLKEYSQPLKKVINSIVKHEKLFLVLTGFIHGFTNLGGALLTAIVYSKNLTKKRTRATIAISYLTFAIFQIITLIFFINYSGVFNVSNSIYWVLGFINFFIVEKFIFIKINEKMYNKIFTVFIFIIGCVLTLKG